MSSWTTEDDFKLLMGIIMENCPKANTKNIEVEGRSPLACHRRFNALKDTYANDQTNSSQSEEIAIQRKSNGALKLGNAEKASPKGLNGTKRKAEVVKKGIAKKAKKGGKGPVGPDVDAWLKDVKAEEDDEAPVL